MSEISQARWRKSSHSSDKGDDCVELAWTCEGVALRDSKAPEAGNLLMSRDAFRSAVALIRSA
ncbi:DUF397 domain-containing protein [Actinomadura oligospora]|uniref:DUF397 domain-containing protein n=1 Tax=Actinomadura oligospora TaxID=111804 RepID=UPI000A033195|nr:DUF397 domain-containing protein [Actinomadura oligospora]